MYEHVYPSRNLVLGEDLLINNTGMYRILEDESLPLVTLVTWHPLSQVFYNPATLEVETVPPGGERIIHKEHRLAVAA